MPTATLKKQWQVAANAGWAETFNFFLGNTATPDSLAGCTAILSVIRPGRPPAEAATFSSTDATPNLTVSGNSVVVDVPRTVTAAWPPGVYDLQLRVFSPGVDVDRYTLIGPGRLNLIEAPGA